MRTHSFSSMGLGRELGTQGSIPLFLEERVTQLENGDAGSKPRLVGLQHPVLSLRLGSLGYGSL